MCNIKTSVIMKSIMNKSKLVITALITSSLFVACSEEITENTVETQYTANTGNIKTAGQAVDLGLASGTKWANMNVGASSENDNGILFIWGDITGTKMMSSSVSTYTDIIGQTSSSALFEMFKGDEMIGTVCDTTNIIKIAEPMLIDLSGIEAAQKKDKIVSFVKDKINDLIGKGYTGFLEATLINDEFEGVIDWDGAQFVERLPGDDDFEKFDYTKTTSLVVNLMGFNDVKYFASPRANNYAEIKDQFGVVMRRDFSGGDISNIPVYNIVGNASYDPATANWGSNWKMPTTDQFKELIDSCDWVFTGTGYKVTGKNGNSIFLPAAGYRYGDKVFGNGNSGYYASGEIYGTYHFPSMAEQISGSKGAVNGNENMPNMLIFQNGLYNSIAIYDNLSSTFGVSIRPVAK